MKMVTDAILLLRKKATIRSKPNYNRIAIYVLYRTTM